MKDKWDEMAIETGKIQNEILSILNKKFGKKGFDEYRKIVKGKLQQLYDSGLTDGELRKIVTWHQLNLGTPPINLCERFDLDGDLSIEKFFKDTLIKVSENF